MNRLNHHHLDIFWVLAKHGSFTKAALHLSIAQSAVTSQVRQLEDSLGLSLVDRKNRKQIQLTSEGARVFDYAQNIFQSSQELMNWAHREQSNKSLQFRIGATSGLSRNLLFEFLKPAFLDPNVKIDVVTADAERLISHLKDHSLDLVLSSRNISADTSTRFYSHVLISSPLVFVSTSSKKISLDQALREWPLVLPGPKFEMRPEIDDYLERSQLSYHLKAEIDDIALLRIVALQKEVVVALPEIGAQNEIKNRDLTVIKRIEKIQQRFYAITREKKIRNSLIDDLILKIKDSPLRN